MPIEIFEQITVFLINITGIWLAYWVYKNKKKEKLNQYFGIMTLFILLWVNFAYLAFISTEISSAIFWYRLNLGIVSLFLFSFYSFYVLYFLEEKGKHIFLEKIILLISFLFFFFSIFTSLIIENVLIKEWGTEVIFGKLYNTFNIFALSVALIILYRFFIRYFSLSVKQKIKIQYFLIGTFLFVLFNIIFNIIVPSSAKTVEYQHFGDYSAIFLLGFTAYAIVKHKLFGIKVILTSIFVTLIAILLLLDILFLTPELLPQLYKGLLLIIFIYFGYLLIKSVMEEIKRREEMEVLSKELKKANLKLEKLVEMREEFLHITSHQLRTPLTAIRGMISMWHDGDFKNLPQEEKNKIKNRIYTSAERLNNITNDMINAMELEGKHFDLKFKPVSLEKIISDAANTLKINYHAKGLFLNFKKPEKALPKIQADPEYLSQVFLNIINNAEKYTENGGTTISILQKAKNFIVEITDTGIGISKEGQKLLFRKFSRGQRAKKVNTTGSGLGLYIAKQVVETHHGEIKVKSAGADKGTTFTVILPIKQPVE